VLQVPPQNVAADPIEPTLRVGARSLALHEVLALARRDVVQCERVRQIVPLASLAALGIGDRVELVSANGDARVVALGMLGLALTTNHRQELKLIDTREGFHRILAPVVEVREARHR
jgi:hypothetical protein